MSMLVTYVYRRQCPNKTREVKREAHVTNRQGSCVCTPGRRRTRVPEPPPTAQRSRSHVIGNSRPSNLGGPAHFSPHPAPGFHVGRGLHPTLPARSPLHLHHSPGNSHAPPYQLPGCSGPAPPTPYLRHTHFRSQTASASASAAGRSTSESCLAVERMAGEVAGELGLPVRLRVRTRRARLGFPPGHCSTGGWWPGPLPRGVETEERSWKRSVPCRACLSHSPILRESTEALRGYRDEVPPKSLSLLYRAHTVS